MDDIYKNIEECNPSKEQKLLIVFDDMIGDIPNNKKNNPVVTELFIRGRKLNTSPVFILFFCAKKYQTKFYTLENSAL